MIYSQIQKLRQIFFSSNFTTRIWMFGRNSIIRPYLPRFMLHVEMNNLIQHTKKTGYGILVYQMGKVGSITVTRSLRAIGIGTYHIHNMRIVNTVCGKCIKIFIPPTRPARIRI